MYIQCVIAIQIEWPFVEGYRISLTQFACKDNIKYIQMWYSNEQQLWINWRIYEFNNLNESLKLLNLIAKTISKY